MSTCLPQREENLVPRETNFVVSLLYVSCDSYHDHSECVSGAARGGPCAT